MRTAPITVVVPLYNKASHVLRALCSVANQTIPPHEILVVDDGSTDDGPDLVEGLEDPRIRLLRRSPPGPGGYAARNLGVEAATSPWVAFLDADDAWKPDHLERLDALIGAAPDSVGCVFTGFENAFAGEAARANPYAALTRDKGVHRLDFDRFIDGWLAARDCPIWTGAACFRREVLVEAGLFPAGRCLRGGDKDLWLRALSLGDALCDPAVTTTYFRDAENMVTKTTSTTRRHCVCSTLGDMITAAPPERAQRLQRLFNMEISQYATRALRAGALPPEIVRGYYVRHDPVRGLAYGLAARLPPGVLREAVTLARSARRRVRALAVKPPSSGAV